MNLRMVTAWGEQHGLMNELANSVSERGFDRFAEKDRAKMEKQRKEDARMIWVKYINYQGPHERLDKHYMRWAGDTIKVYHLIPNHEYYLPKGLVEEINGNPGLADRGEKVIGDKIQAKDGRPQKIHELIEIPAPSKAA